MSDITYSPSLIKLHKKSLSMLVSLVLQYLFGMYIAMFAVPPDDPKYLTEPIFNKIIFGLHGLLGISLLVVSIIILAIGLKNIDKEMKKLTVLGFLSILLAFIAGMMTVILKDNASEVASFFMSVGFILSFIFYIKLFYYKKNI